MWGEQAQDAEWREQARPHIVAPAGHGACGGLDPTSARREGLGGDGCQGQLGAR